MTLKEIDSLIEEGESLKAITQAYSEIANLKIKKIRSAVERNRMFFAEIGGLYAIVKAFAIQKNIVVKKPKKALHILLTSNYRFYGNINSSLIKYFIGSTHELKETDIYIVGHGGIEFFKSTNFFPDFTASNFKSDLPDDLELTNFVQTLSQYNQVLVFYTKFKSLLVQKATFEDITATSLYTRDFYVPSFNVNKQPEILKFIFEPDLPKILSFFESQILNLLLEQTFLESELSRTASRFISMDQAEGEANKFISDNIKMRAVIKKDIMNRQLIESFASSFLSRNKTL